MVYALDMDFQTPLLPARLIKRYKRFLADIELETGEIVTAHCANPGSMMGLAVPDTRVWVEPNDDPKKKLNYSWKLNEYPDGTFCVIDTSIANRVVKEALSLRKIEELSSFSGFRPEVKYGDKSRVDFLLEDSSLGNLYLEVKSVTLSRHPKLAEFPDSVTARGAKHLNELSEVVTQGARAALFYVVNRTDCDVVDVARDIDPTYAKALDDVKANGVEVYAYGCDISPKGVTLANSIALRS